MAKHPCGCLGVTRQLMSQLSPNMKTKDQTHADLVSRFGSSPKLYTFDEVKADGINHDYGIDQHYIFVRPSELCEWVKTLDTATRNLVNDSNQFCGWFEWQGEEDCPVEDCNAFDDHMASVSWPVDMHDDEAVEWHVHDASQCDVLFVTRYL